MSEIFAEGEVFVQEGVLVVKITDEPRYKYLCRNIRYQIEEGVISVNCEAAQMKLVIHSPFGENVYDQDLVNSVQDQYTKEEISVVKRLFSKAKVVNRMRVIEGWVELKNTNTPQTYISNLFRVVLPKEEEFSLLKFSK